MYLWADLIAPAPYPASSTGRGIVLHKGVPFGNELRTALRLYLFNPTITHGTFTDALFRHLSRLPIRFGGHHAVQPHFKIPGSKPNHFSHPKMRNDRLNSRYVIHDPGDLDV